MPALFNMESQTHPLLWILKKTAVSFSAVSPKMGSAGLQVHISRGFAATLQLFSVSPESPIVLWFIWGYIYGSPVQKSFHLMCRSLLIVLLNPLLGFLCHTKLETIVFNNQNPSLQNQVLGNIDTNINKYKGRQSYNWPTYWSSITY